MPPFYATALHSYLHAILPYLPTAVSSYIYSTLFLLNQGLSLPTSPPLQKSTTILHTSTHSLDTHIFTTPNACPTRTILIIHGLAATAHNDPRIHSLATALASASPRNLVLIPHLPPLGDCDLSADPISLVTDLIATVASTPSLCPTGRLSLASACISAGFSLVAATRHPPAVHSILTIGTHASVAAVMENAIARKGLDDSVYAVNSVIGSFLSPRTVVADMLVAYVLDDHFRNVGLPAHNLENLLNQHPREAEEYYRIRDDSDYMAIKLRDIYRDNQSTFEHMSPINCLKSLQCEALSLVHAKQDDIIPFSESVMIADELKDRHDIHTSLCITDMLNHGDQREPALSDIAQVLSLISTFSAFFRNDRTAATSKSKNV